MILIQHNLLPYFSSPLYTSILLSTVHTQVKVEQKMIFESQCQETGVDVPVSEQVSSNNSFGTPLQGGQERGIKNARQ